MKKRNPYLLIMFLISILFLYSGNLYAEKEETPVLKKIDVLDEGKKVRILIEGSSPFTYTVFKLTDPVRIVVDIPGVEAGQLKGKIAVGKHPLLDISTTEKEKPYKLVRVEISLSNPIDVTTYHQDNRLYIDIPKPDSETKNEDTAKLNETTSDEKVSKTEVKPAVSKPSLSRTEFKKEGLSATAKEEKLKRSAVVVTGLKVDKEKGLKVIISGEGEMKYQAFILKPNRLVIDIPDAVNKARPVTYEVGDPLLSNVRIGQHIEPKKKVRVVLDLTQPLSYEVIKEKNQLIISLKTGSTSEETAVAAQKKDNYEEPTAIKETIAEKEIVKEKKESMPAKPEIKSNKDATAKKEINRGIGTSKMSKKSKTSPFKKDDTLDKEIPSIEIAPLAQKMEEPAASAQKETPEEPVSPSAEKPKHQKITVTPVTGKYTGRKISLDFQDADIVSILKLISEVSGMNIIASPEVKGKITVKMLNVPWDQALNIILKTYHLGKVVEDNIIRVAPIPVLAKERSEIAKAKEEEDKAEDLVTKIIPLGYADPKSMKVAIDKTKVLSPRGHATIDDRTNTMIIRDIEKNLAEVEALISVLDKPTPQVSIEAKIVEASTNFSRELGIQWGFKNIQDAAHGNPLPYTFPHSMTFGGSTLAGTSPGASPAYMSGNPWAVNLPAALGGTGTGGALGIALGSITNSFTLDLQISAMEGTGQGKILSNPKIVTLDNEKAMIKQGRKIPYATVSAEGTKTEFVDAVLSLTVTPTITPGGAISMKIEVTKDEPGATTPAGPIIEKKEASTNVLVRDGDTIVIGGIMTTKKLDDTAGIPLLHKIPILGWLFKKETIKEDTTELLIFITPRIVKPI